jgi:nucleotide-binding universal stress UspA family protein
VADHPIVVGYDGSSGARAALRWALDESAHRGLPVRLVWAVERPLRAVPRPPLPGDMHSGDVDRTGKHHAAQTLLDDAVAQARGVVGPDAEITGVVVEGPPAAVLCDQSEHASLLVLGSRGLGGFTGLFVSSVSAAVAAGASCPLVVVREDDRGKPAGLPVAVGVDDSADAELAIGFAFEEAALRGTGVLAVRSWAPPHAPWHIDVRPLVADVAELETAQRYAVAQALQGWRAKFPGVALTTRLIAGDARHALAAVSHDVQLVVVGSRGHGGFGGLLLGSVSHYLLLHAACPVAVLSAARGRGADRPQ